MVNRQALVQKRKIQKSSRKTALQGPEMSGMQDRDGLCYTPEGVKQA